MSLQQQNLQRFHRPKSPFDMNPSTSHRPPPVFHGNESHLDWRRWNGIRTAPLSHLFFFSSFSSFRRTDKVARVENFPHPNMLQKKNSFLYNPGPTFSSPYLLVVSALFKPCKSPYLSAAVIHPSNPTNPEKIQLNCALVRQLYCFLMDNFTRLEIVLKSRWRTCGINISSVFCTSAHYWTPQQTPGIIMYHSCIFTPSIHPANHPSKIH